MRAPLLMILTVCATCSAPPTIPTSKPHTSAPPTVDVALLRTIAGLATARQPSAAELDDARARIERGELTIPKYIDSLLDGDRFAHEVAPLVIMRHVLGQESVAPEQKVLQVTSGSPPIYHLGPGCSASSAVSVHPWWDLDHEVRVCPDAYRPDTWLGVDSHTPVIACLAGMSHRTKGCGCGPNLVRCLPSEDTKQAIRNSLRDEVRDTVAYLTTHDRPVAELFTSNMTYRDRNAEYVELEQQIEIHRDAHPEAMLRTLADWPAAGQWAPRKEFLAGQHAGALTTPQVLYFVPDRRQRMTTIYDVLWCMEPDSIGATPQSVLSLKSSADLQIASAGWQELAARPLCTNCHARLDYGGQFFWGYQNPFFQAYFWPELQPTGRGPLYARDISDLRGESELSAHAFAVMATAQPEFKRCMARDFAEYVLGDRVTEASLDAVEAATSGSPKQLMRAALLQLVEGWSATPVDTPGATAAKPATAPDRIAVVGALKHELDKRCTDCHDGTTPDRPDFTQPQLARAAALHALDAVAFGRMPKSGALDPLDRRRFLDALIDATWLGSERDVARSYFEDRATALHAYRPEVIFGLIGASAGAKGSMPWRLIDNVPRPDLQVVTPGVSVLSGLAAIEACRAKHKQQRDVDACITAALKIENLATDARGARSH